MRVFKFGSRVLIPESHTFHLTPDSFCFVNLSPVVPGHVLVSPLVVRTRMEDMTGTTPFIAFLFVSQICSLLTDGETSDLLLTGREVQVGLV